MNSHEFKIGQRVDLNLGEQEYDGTDSRFGTIVGLTFDGPCERCCTPPTTTPTYHVRFDDGKDELHLMTDEFGIAANE